MTVKIRFLGGFEEIGANSTYFYLDGTGIILDAGLHPKKRDRNAFPKIENIADEPADLLALSHAHTDHIGGIPYVLKYHPQLKIFATRATRDLVEYMLKDSAKILKSEIALEYSDEMLSLFKPEVLRKINLIIDGFKYNEDISFTGNSGLQEVKMKFLPSGHILGSAALYMEVGGKNILHTSDVNFADQNLIPAAELPRHHIDTLIIESTNAGTEPIPGYQSEKQRLATFINEVVNENGSLLLPVFALGKMQEILKILYDLMWAGKIPHLPIFTGGLGKVISKVYDRYNYTVPRRQPGFKVADIPQEKIIYDELLTGKYFKEPALVVVQSGMMNKGTLSFNLAKSWFMRNNFGIAFAGYVDQDTPGNDLLRSERGKEFSFAGKKTKRACKVEHFRFTSHARKEDLQDYIMTVKPNDLFVVHGDTDACENLALFAKENLPQTNVRIPEIGTEYEINT